MKFLLQQLPTGVALLAISLALVVSGCHSTRETIERNPNQPLGYRFKDPELRNRVSFSVPKHWKLSHPPEGGTAGLSCFFNEQREMLTIEMLPISGESGRTQQELYDAWLAEDRKEEPQRLKEAEELVRGFDKTNLAADTRKQFNATTNDHAEFQRLTSAKTEDGSEIWIVRFDSPLRGTWFQASIPVADSQLCVRIFRRGQSESDTHIADIRFAIESCRAPDSKRTNARSSSSAP